MSGNLRKGNLCVLAIVSQFTVLVSELAFRDHVATRNMPLATPNVLVCLVVPTEQYVLNNVGRRHSKTVFVTGLGISFKPSETIRKYRLLLVPQRGKLRLNLVMDGNDFSHLGFQCLNEDLRDMPIRAVYQLRGNI